jgi:hypothetical protein
METREPRVELHGVPRLASAPISAVRCLQGPSVAYETLAAAALVTAPPRIAAKHSAEREIPWWLWWNVLSLDAPMVAGAWGWLFARASGVSLSVSVTGVLMLAVWTIYTWDRLLDDWNVAEDKTSPARHEFCRRHRVALVALAATASAVIVYVAKYRLLAGEVRAGMWLGALVVCYMAGIHAGRRTAGAPVPKELAVGAIFAAGVALPCWSRGAGTSWAILLSWVLFAALCSLNCLLIETWESRGRDAAGGTGQALFVWVERRSQAVAWCLALVGCAAAWRVARSAVFAAAEMRHETILHEIVFHETIFHETSFHQAMRLAGVFGAVGLGAVLLLLLKTAQRKFSAPALRVLADAALLVPALLAAVLQGVRP